MGLYRSNRLKSFFVSVFAAVLLTLPGCYQNGAGDFVLFGLAEDYGQLDPREEGCVYMESPDKHYIVHQNPDHGHLRLEFTLPSQPTESVTIPLSLHNPEYGNLSRESLVFTSENWNVAQEVTITGNPDRAGGGHGITSIVFGTSESDDSNYNNCKKPSVTGIIIVDDSTQSIIVSPPPEGIRTQESTPLDELGQDYFAIALSQEPEENVTISEISSLDPTEGLLYAGIAEAGDTTTEDIGPITFTPANWNEPQIITVRNVDDFELDGDQLYEIVLKDVTSDDDNYACTADACSEVYFIHQPRSVAFNEVPALNLDNYRPAITVDPVELHLEEQGPAQEFTVSLNVVPQDGDVRVPISNPHPDRATLSGDHLVGGEIIFQQAEWDIEVGRIERIITVTPVPNDTYDDDITFILDLATTINLPENVDPDNVTVHVQDNNSPGILFNELNRSTDEDGQDAKFCVRLNSKPSAPVTVAIDDLHDEVNAGHEQGYVGSTPESSTLDLVFDETNWNVMQEVTVTPLAFNEIMDGDVQYDIWINNGISADTHYNNLQPTVRGISWNSNRTNCNSAPGTSPSQDNRIIVNHRDTDTAGFVIEAKNRHDGGTSTITMAAGNRTISGFVTDASGNLDPAEYSSWRIKLRSEPREPVTIELASQSDSGTLNETTHTFNTNKSGGNGWNEWTDWFEVTGQSGGPTGNHTYNVTLDITTGFTGTYGYRNSTYVGEPTFRINSCDNHSRDFTYCGRSGSSHVTTESGGTTRLYFIGKSSGSQCVPTWSSDEDEVIAHQDGDGSSVAADAGPGGEDVAVATINSGNYNTIEPGGTNSVVFIGVPDDTVDGNQTVQVIIGEANCSGSGYTQSGDHSPRNVTNVDIDGTLEFCSASGETEEVIGNAHGTSATFGVRLSRQPDSNVDVPVSCGNSSCYSVSPSSVTFTSGNWNSCQDITVTGANINGVQGTTTIRINFGALTSADPYFDGVNPPSHSPITHRDADRLIRVPQAGGTGANIGIFGGNFNDGILTADSACNNSSTGYGHPGFGTYKALLGTTDSAPAAERRIATTNGSNATGQYNWVLEPNTRYYLQKGSAPYTTLLFTTNQYGLFTGSLNNAFETNPENHWTGLNNDLTTATGNNCGDWRSGAGTNGRYGSGTATNATAINAGEDDCADNPRRLICVQQ